MSPRPAAIRYWFVFGLALMLMVSLSGIASAAAQPPEPLTRVSVREDGSQANGASDSPALSADGRYLAFSSNATNLTEGKTQNVSDVYVRDNSNGKIVKITNNPQDPQSTGDWGNPSISGDGRWIAYMRTGGSNSTTWVAIHDRDSDRDGIFDEAGASTTIYPVIHRVGHNIEYNPSIFTQFFGLWISVSRNGRYAVFSVAYIDSTEYKRGVFLLDLAAGSQAEWIADGQNPVISASGQYIVYCSADHPDNPSNTTIDVFELNRDTDGKGVFDVPGKMDLVLVSQNDQGVSGNSSSGLQSSMGVSDDGRFVLFDSQATNFAPNDQSNFTDVFLRDLQEHTTTLISAAADGSGTGDNSSGPAALSSDGSQVIFWSNASNLVSGDSNTMTDLFLWERSSGSARRISVAQDGSQANNASGHGAAISADGKLIAFESQAGNLVPDDDNFSEDIFLLGTYVLPNHTTWLPMIAH